MSVKSVLVCVSFVNLTREDFERLRKKSTQFRDKQGSGRQQKEVSALEMNFLKVICGAVLAKLNNCWSLAVGVSGFTVGSFSAF